MTERRPLVLISGATQELPSGDTVAGASGSGTDYATVLANHTLVGGGIITWNSSYYLKWATRLLCIPVEKDEKATSGYFTMSCPTSGTIIRYAYDGSTDTETCTANGIPFTNGTYPFLGLFYQFDVPQSSSSDATNFRLVSYVNPTWSPGEGWVLLAVRYAYTASPGDGGHILWAPGRVVIPDPTGGYTNNTYNSFTGECSWLNRLRIHPFETI